MPILGKTTSLIFIMLVVLSSAGCATKPTKVQKVYQTESAIEAFKSVMVVSVGKDRINREKMERAIVTEIEAEKGAAIRAVDLISSSEGLSKDTVTKVVIENSVDGVLVINLLESAVKVDIDEKRTETIIERPQPEKLINVFVRHYKEVDIAREMNINATVIISADFYSGKSGDKVWSVQTTVYEGTDADPIIADAAKAIVKQLAKDKLI